MAGEGVSDRPGARHRTVASRGSVVVILVAHHLRGARHRAVALGQSRKILALSHLATVSAMRERMRSLTALR